MISSSCSIGQFIINIYLTPLTNVTQIASIISMEENKMKYRAHVEIDGKRLIVFPRSKKTSLFDSITEAESKLNQLSKKLSKDARGFISDTTGAIVLTVAL